MKVAFVASEAIPYAKTGGLADVVGSLPLYLGKLGIKVHIYLPKYRGVKGLLIHKMQVSMGDTYDVGIYKLEDFFFVDYPPFFERKGLYGTEAGDFPDNFERFTLFCKAVAQVLTEADYDIVHCHDWQTALIPLYLLLDEKKTKSIFTIHNLGYQGKFPSAKFPLLGLEEEFFTAEGIEYYGEINFLKAGILYSDAVTTVSENYAREIQTPEFGFGLDGVLRRRKGDLYGIINGINYEIWNPETDGLIYEKYKDYAGKLKNKSCLAREFKIDDTKPLIGMVSRIAAQKGFDILVEALEPILALGFNIIVLGVGDEELHERLSELSQVYKNRLTIQIKFDNQLAHRIYAGSDFFLMPSAYEPCGLGQLISLRYGTVPVVHRTGGLADTVKEFNAAAMSGNGFLFEEYSSQDLVKVLARAKAVYSDQRLFKNLSEQCMRYDFSWNESARRYKNLYESLLRPRKDD